MPKAKNKSNEQRVSQLNQKSKKLTKKKTKDKKNQTKVSLPNRPELISANWKALMTTISKKDTHKKGFQGRRRQQQNNDVSMKKSPASENNQKESKPKHEIWFDDVDEDLLDIEDRPSIPQNGQESCEKSLVKDKSFKGLTRVIGLDCEMVGVGFGGKDSVLARVSIVNHFGNCIYDKYVKPVEKVTDYRTHVSGIRPKDIVNGENFKTVQKEVSDILKNRILVGHALKHDLKVLFLNHPRKDMRDTSQYKFFRNAFGGKTPSLKNLTERMLGVKVQEGEHSSVQDAQAAVRLYTMFRKDWEKNIVEKIQRKRPNSSFQEDKKPEDKTYATTKTEKRVVHGQERRYYSDSD